MLVDMRGIKLKVGQTVVRACNGNGYQWGQLEEKVITEIRDNKVYLSGSKVPMKNPDRLAVVVDI